MAVASAFRRILLFIAFCSSGGWIQAYDPVAADALLRKQVIWLESVATKDPFFKPQTYDELSDLPLGDIVVDGGAKYEECVLLDRSADTIRFRHKGGTSEVLRRLLPIRTDQELRWAKEALDEKKAELLAEKQRAAEEEGNRQLAIAREQLAAEERQRRNRPVNNTIFVKSSGTGTGQFVVNNGTDLDAIVNLASTSTSKIFASVYVRAGESATVPRIRANDYVIVYAQGRNYDLATRFFSEFVRAARFAEAINYPRVADQPKGQNTIWKINLHTTPDGEAQVKPLSEAGYFDAAR